MSARKTEIHYKWPIPDYNSNNRSSFFRSSPKFSGGPNSEYTWRINVEYGEYGPQLNLTLVTCDKPAVEAACKMTTIISGHNRQFYQDPKTFETGVSVVMGRWMGSGILTMVVCDITIDDAIAIQEEEDIHEELFPAYSKKLEGLKHQSAANMFDNLINLLESHQFCDVTVISASREIPAHKVILAARSPVFLAMFSHEMKEQQENRVEITDFDDEVVMEMLRFIYTGKIPNLDKMAEELLPAANKYQLLTLKELCALALYKSIETENVVNRFILSDLYDLVELKAAALDFICKHAEEVIKTTGYKLLSTTHPKLMDEAFQAIVTEAGRKHKRRP